MVAAMSENPKGTLPPNGLTTVSLGVAVCIFVFSYISVYKEALTGKILFRAKVLSVLFIVQTKSKTFLPGG